MVSALAQRIPGSDRLFAILLFTVAGVAAGVLVVNSLPGKGGGSQLAGEIASLDAAPAAPPSAAAAPSPFPTVRYAQMSAKSPFAVATAAAAEAAPTPGFAANLYIAGVARVNNDSYVTIKSRTDPDKSLLFLQVGQSSPDGMKVMRLDWSDEMGKSKVTVSKDGETAILTFDQDEIEKAGTVANANPAEGPNRLPMMPGGRPIMPQAGPNGAAQFFQRNRVFGPGAQQNAGPAVAPQVHRRGIIPPGP